MSDDLSLPPVPDIPAEALGDDVPEYQGDRDEYLVDPNHVNIEEIDDDELDEL